MVLDAFGNLPLYFIENRGQLDARVAYYAQGADTTVYFTSEGVTFAMTGRRDRPMALDAPMHAASPWTVAIGTAPAKEAAVQRWILKLDFISANSNVQPSAQDPTPAVISYFKGTKDQWKTGLKTYATMVYADLWPGIDLIYSGTINHLKYTFVVKPGADPQQIKLAYRGATAIGLTDAGQLAVSTPMGGFRDESPYAYQEVGRERVEVAATYALEADASAGTHVYGFQVGTYDISKPLVIDPAVLIYAGFIGGSSLDEGLGIAVDGFGNAYVTGGTISSQSTFPVTAGPDLTSNGLEDAFVAKVDANGTGLVYAGYIGGSGIDLARGIAVDGAGNAYVTGDTRSDETTFPVTVGPDLTYNGGSADAFVAKVNVAGTSLLYAGYIGGSSGDNGSGIAVDSAGNAYVTGSTESDEVTFPVTVGPELEFNGGFTDAFVAKVDATGVTLLYAGYIGGSGDDEGLGIAIDGVGNVYVTGDTGSSEATFPVVVGPDLSYNGNFDAFVAKVNSFGTSFVYAGYVGGADGDEGLGIAVDSGGNAYVTGATHSDQATFPVTAGPDLSHNGFVDAFVAKVNASGTGFAYAGYIGGGGIDAGSGIAVDSAGNAYVTGWTDSTQATFPAAGGPDTTHNGSLDAFVAKVDVAGASLVYAGYIGGSGGEEGFGIAVDSTGNAYVTGDTGAGFPVIGGPDLTYNGGPADAFVAKISETFLRADLSVTKTDSPDPIAVGKDLTYTIIVKNFGPDTATGVTLTDDLPDEVGFVSASAGCVYNQIDHTVTCGLGALTSGSTATVTIVVRPVQGGTIENAASVRAIAGDPNPDDNTAAASTVVHGPPNPPQPPACEMVNKPPQAKKPPICP